MRSLRPIRQPEIDTAIKRPFGAFFHSDCNIFTNPKTIYMLLLNQRHIQRTRL